MAEINVTPMVDVMLVLLIIFMVTAPLLTTGVPVDLPDSRAGAFEQDQKPVALSLDRNGRIYIGDTEVEPTALPDALHRIAARQVNGKPPQILLRADGTLDYARVTRVMGELNRAGLNRVAMIAAQSDGP